MLSKSIIKYIQSLHHRKFRDQYSVFIAETPVVIKDLLRSGKLVCKMIFAIESFFQENEALLLPVSQNNKMQLTPGELQKISLLHTPNQVLAIFQKKKAETVTLQKRLNLVLDDIQDPGNMGTLLRIADWFNIKNIICSHDCAEQYNPKVVQASMGSLARVNVIYTDLEKFITGSRPINAYAATLGGASLYSLAALTEGLLIIGNESKGIRPELLQLAAAQVTIPRFGGAESLNAAVAAGIILSHIVRQ